MALENAPWAVDGAKHSAAVARTLAYASTSGAEGIVEPADLHVRATQTPSGSVRVAPGGIAILNRAPNGGQQTYTARNVSETLVEVQPTGSGGGRTDYVWAHIVDPEYGGQFPENPQTAQYFFLTASASQPEGNGWYKLARIDIPASTATITQAMITDLREVANPREKSFIYTNPTVVATEETLTATQDKGELFPDIGSIKAKIPEYATRVQIEAEWLQVAQPAGDFNGRIWVEWGPYVEASVRRHRTQWFAVNGNNSNNLDRAYWKVAQEMYISPDLRGTDQIFFLKGRLLSHSGASSRPRLDSASGVVLSLRFLEVADQFTVNE